MPGLDRTGPLGQGPRTGRGRGVGTGQGRAAGRGTGLGQGLGRGAGRRGVGGVAECVCPKCGHKAPHARGVPCTEVKCPKCETMMQGDYCLPEEKKS